MGTSCLLHPERFQSDIRRNFFMERVFRDWDRLSRDAMESPFLEVFKRRVDA